MEWLGLEAGNWVSFWLPEKDSCDLSAATFAATLDSVSYRPRNMTKLLFRPVLPLFWPRRINKRSSIRSSCSSILRMKSNFIITGFTKLCNVWHQKLATSSISGCKFSLGTVNL